jgi:Terminase small subunit
MTVGTLTAKQERFCLLLVKGLTQTKAYEQAGYKTKGKHVTEANASRLANNAKVVERMAFLRGQLVKKTGVSLESETRRLLEIEDMAVRDGEYSPAISAHALLARMHGLINEHKTVDIVHHKPAKEAVMKDIELSEDEWLRLYKP